MTAPYKKLGDRIAGNRVFCDYSQRKLADMAGVHFTYISKIESGNLPTAPGRLTLTRIGQAIHVEPVELFMLAGSFDAGKLHERALENKDTAALLIMLENGQLSAVTLRTIVALAMQMESDE